MSIGDTWPGLLLLVAILALLLYGQIRQRVALHKWLLAPDASAVPDGVGAWRAVFSQLQRLHKDEQSAYQALANSLERFRLAAEALPDGVILLDGDQHIEWLNATAAHHFALDAWRDIGTQIGHLIRHSDFHQLLASDRRGGPPEPLLLRLNGNGPEQIVSIALIPYAGTGTLLLSRDVTERARSEAMRRDFVANVSHELRTPLTVISGFIEQFTGATPPSGDAAQRFYRLIAEQSTRMISLVADLLTLSRLENDTQPPVDEIIPMDELLDTLCAEAEALAEGKLTVVIGRNSAGKLRGSSHEIRSAFGNLVSNAVRYTPAGGTVTLAWQVVEGCPVFSVSDTGIGIPAEHIPRLTERFYRIDKGRSSATGGTGLGLAIVKHVLVRHQGRLTIQSEIGRGSVFSAVLPASRCVVAQAATL
ncbi:MAG TPA: phosphate regulon sensor histidine kinase PhoR [Accumulibacter sp.]|uniref:phosphate regulon sensor histidine kinase PhoR n=2 Tax=Accumulibacter sp. TaxID=2053492 RepID=UPI002879918F|nr:phosphate regulon sensor histidine kinase PhoR [Accumulibacter sp.]MDS4056712.1 phosphate regulon sensor histidine kinase PhoR [Accumulibacter sp.]HMV06589.1 phosphate regulon sensor histidine kinase PhoR [Accumulibacter sp.]HMW64652.1 phosphate regulon sensor histidine kinase PhoR [Accumulibacter sp.]HMW81744.1 phosphate regulon sensor histidine kinase PhoR [Accumulibacter sp.]HMX67357.1 phosphate regulon sensor histidine kinase PhoR [Accumulibacter sp.]